MTIEVERSGDLTALTWKGGRTPAGRTALLSCPDGHIASLSQHTIAADGTVSPSVVCPEPGCDFHEHVRLVGWEAEP